MSDGVFNTENNASDNQILPSTTGAGGMKATATAGTGGIAAILNVVLLNILDEKSIAPWLTVTPIVSAALVWLFTYIWESVGEDPKRNKDMRVLKKRAKLAKADMKDKNLSDAAREKARQDYENSREAIRNY